LPSFLLSARLHVNVFHSASSEPSAAENLQRGVIGASFSLPLASGLSVMDELVTAYSVTTGLPKQSKKAVVHHNGLR